MTSFVYRCVAVALLCLLPITATAAAKRSTRAFETTEIGGKGKTALVAAAFVAAGAVIGVGIYLAVRASHSMTGCVITGAQGLELQKESNHETYLLLGATQGIKPGDRVRVHGSKKKKVPGVTESPSFVVEKLNKDYGFCPAS